MSLVCCIVSVSYVVRRASCVVRRGMPCLACRWDLRSVSGGVRGEKVVDMVVVVVFVGGN